jgi:L-alanine-DL-glutamate epimerase-like enolase superfamily enzyme
MGEAGRPGLDGRHHPWQYTELWKKITDAIEVPTITGEDIYLKEDFIKLAQSHAVDILHPDIATSGGILETHKIGDAIQDYGVPMALHMAKWHDVTVAPAPTTGRLSSRRWRAAYHNRVPGHAARERTRRQQVSSTDPLPA